MIILNKKRVLVTCALPYINNVPHLGNLLTILAADVYTRFLKKQGKNTIYICATDEHGTRTEIEAKKARLTPAQYSMKLHSQILKLYKWFDIEFDHFGRTDHKFNHKVTTDIFLKLYKRGYIQEQEVTQLYCPKCKQFLPDTYVEGTCPHCKSPNAKGDQCDECTKLLESAELISPRCKVCGTAPQSRTTKHLFLDLPKLEPKVAKWIKSKTNWKGVAKSIPLGWLKEGLRERCITRDLKFGVKVPLKGYEDKVFYVWFDAPNGYVSSTQEWAAKNHKNWKLWWFDKDTHYVQFMGKDNVPFHTVFWPAILLGTGDKWHLVDYLSSNEYLNYEGGQFSKSQKRGVFIDDVASLGLDPDLWRFYLMLTRPETKDSDFSWSDFQEKINNELIANLGNFVYRTLSFAKKNFGKVPRGTLGVKEKTLLRKSEVLAKQANREMCGIELKKALKTILSISTLGNQYFQNQKPWETLHSDSSKCKTTIYTCAKLIALLDNQLEPFVPGTAKKIKDQLKGKNAGLLFKKIDDAQIQALEKRFAGEQSAKIDTKPMVKYQDFNKLDFRVGKIVSVEDVPDADKIYKMKVSFGAETRQVVAGLKQYYKPSELRGKKAVFIVNLEPATIRGLKSKAMILAAEDSKRVIFIAPEKNVKEGSKIL